MNHPEPDNAVTRRTSGSLRKWFLVLGLTIGLIAALGVIKFLQISAAIAGHASFELPPETVTTVVVSDDNWPTTLTSVGTLKPVNGLMLRADLGGKVVAIKFESGSPVKKGDILVQQDISEETAQLRAAEARRRLAELNLQRSQGLLDKRVSSQSDYDQTAAEALQAQAAREQIQAVIEKKTIRAPFDGIAGIRRINVGEYLQAGDPIVQVQALDPIYVDFSLPQQDLDNVQPGSIVKVRPSGIASDPFEGAVTAIDAVVDESTRNFLVQATLKNPAGTLRPGMFAQVEVLVPGERSVVSIPATAVSYAPYGDSVFVLEQMTDEKQEKTYTGVRQTFVKLGEARGDRIEILSGLKAGDEVATSGIFKLRPNAAVVVNNEVQPGNDLNPTPADR
jgi:membrane fusion protein (multidrug efflux system)